MNSNRRSIMAVVGPLVGVALLVLILNYGLNTLRQAQDEAREAARIQELVDRTGAGDAQAAETEVQASETVTDGAAMTATEGVTGSAEVTTSVEVGAGEVITASEEMTRAEDLDSAEPVTATAASVEASDAVTESATTDAVAAPAGMGPGGMGMGRGMAGGSTRMFHMTPIPEEYAGTLSPVPADAESIARGEPLFQQNCVVCHGETGLGDGVAAAGLDPAPPMIAMTSQMLGDDYMLWRISEGGAMEPFNSAMPTWKAVLSEDQRWDVINYVRSLGAAMPAGQGGGPGSNADLEAQMRAEMLLAAVEQGVVTQEQADLFDAVHSQIDTLRAAHPNRQFTGTMRDLQDQLLVELVAGGDVSPEDADEFNAVLTILEESGLMQ